MVCSIGTETIENAEEYRNQSEEEKISFASWIFYLRKFDGRVLYPIAKARGFTTHWIKKNNKK